MATVIPPPELGPCVRCAAPLGGEPFCILDYPISAHVRCLSDEEKRTLERKRLARSQKKRR